MGNCICMSSSITHLDQTAKVIYPDGKVKEFSEPIRAKEILGQHPSPHFICHSDCVDVGKFMDPVDSEAELELGEVYFVLPLKKLQYAVSMADMASMLFTANCALKSKNGVFYRVLPEERRVAEEEVGDLGDGLSGDVSKTKLETIREGIVL